MMHWQDIQFFITRHSNQIRSATRPLREQLGVDYFTYHKIDTTGRYTVLVDRPDWAEVYIEQQLFKQDPYLRHPNAYSSGIALMNHFGSKGYQDGITEYGKLKLGMDIGVVAIQRQGDAVEIYGFTGSKRSALQSIYTNHSQLLFAFGAHFKKKLHHLLREMDENKISLPELKGDDFFCKDLIQPSLSLAKRLEYLQSIGFGSPYLHLLSPREWECLDLLRQGKSSKETGAFLGISARTVESYFEQIKNKLGCQTKRDLFDIIKYL